ncbi:VIT family protein [Luteimonas sp. FXH3W]|jgi:VIT1/CCC1 family predicted Fe2+/Mn2+ transporter|uniref:VIT family protein n=2 Tax=Aquilutibacter rugosus TaxID=3115820 RepID=A0ABU7UZN9_9GAMM
MMRHSESHRVHRVGWLRAAVLGANDGIISTASLIVGVAAAGSSKQQVLVAGLAAGIAGAMSMAAGEYVSVSSQQDTQEADLARERHELATGPEAEHNELKMIYQSRGLTPELADEVARQLTEHDALAAHARDELGITDFSSANPLQAAFTSALTFAVGALLPLLIVLVAPAQQLVTAVVAAALVLLVALGAVGARAGGSSYLKSIVRVTVWGAFAMAATALVGNLFGVATA